MLLNQQNNIRETSKKFRKKTCPQHQVSYIQKVCTHSTCIGRMTSSFLCNQCFRKHTKNHIGFTQYYLEFDKIFSKNVFVDIELLENRCSDILLENKQRVDAEIDKQCNIILEEIKQLIESIKFRIKQKYGTNNLIDTITKLKESLLNEYNTLFSIHEPNIKDDDIKQYLEFYLNYEKLFEENQANNEVMYQSIESELSNISLLFNEKLKDIRSIL